MRNRITTPLNGKAARTGYAVNGPSTAVCDGENATKPAPKPEQKPPTEPAPNAERTATGQFAKGNRCSLGNPFARRLGGLRSAFLNAVTDADVAAVARKLAELAAAGDVQAAALLLSYAVGKPLAAVNPDRLDLEEFAIMDAAPTKARAVAVMLDAVDPSLAGSIVRSVLSADQAEVAESLTRLKKRELLAVQSEGDARIGRPVG